MSFDTLRKRRLVKIVNISASDDNLDDYGNPIREEAEPVEVYATREQLTSSEDILDRDQQARTFRYFFRPSVVIDGRSKIIDGDDTLRVVGEPEVLSSAVAKHHIEAIAELIEG